MTMKHEMKYTTAQLKEFQALPLERKVGLTCARLTEFYTHFDGKVFVSFSGGKDSTVLLHIARCLFPDIPALFLNTGLEYPDIVEFVKTFDNVDDKDNEDTIIGGWEGGKHYTFYITINANAIVFTASITDWVTPNNGYHYLLQ